MPPLCVFKFFVFNILCVQFILLFHMLRLLHAVEYCMWFENLIHIKELKIFGYLFVLCENRIRGTYIFRPNF